MVILFIVLLNVAALVTSLLWFIRSGHDYEPFISMINTVTTLITLFYFRDRIASIIKVKGNLNELEQKGLSREASVKGDSNKIKQI